MKREWIKTYKALRKFCGGEPTIEMVRTQMKDLSNGEIEELIEYMKEPQEKPMKKKRGRPPIVKEDTPIVVQEQKSEVSHKIIPFLRWPMLIFAILAFILSCYFGISWYSKQQPILIAWMLGITLIGFGLFCFEIGIYRITQKMKGGWVFLTVWFFILVYSITTTVSSLYDTWDARIDKEQTSTAIVDANATLLDSYKKQIDEIDTTIQDKRIRIKSFQNTLELYSTPALKQEHLKEWNEANWGAISIEKQIKDEQIKREIAVKKRDTLLTEHPDAVVGVKKKRDFYQWLGGVFRKSVDVIQFILQTIPATVLDIVSCLSLYTFLFLGRKGIDSKKKNK